MKRWLNEWWPVSLILLICVLAIVGILMLLFLLPGPDIPAELQVPDPDRYTMVANILGTYVYRFLDEDTICYLAIDHTSGGVSIFCK